MTREPYADACPNCSRRDNRPLTIQRADDVVRAQYRCPRCLWSWWTAWDNWTNDDPSNETAGQNA